MFVQSYDDPFPNTESNDMGDVLDYGDIPQSSDRIFLANLSVLDMLDGFFEDDDEEGDPEYEIGMEEVEEAIR